jgi:serine/threonine protein kinase
MYDVGTFVDRYRVERVIGNDAVAVVYGVRHTMLGSRHALKLLTRNSQAADRALQGARDQATLHHPHIVALTDILHVASRVGLVMELVEGGSLEAFVAERPPSLDEALGIFRGVVRGVRYAHERRVLHGGLAMRRILLDRTEGRLVPKVTGFGVEGALPAGPDALDDVSRIAGLPPRLDTDADLTQLGAILYELLTGRRPSAGSHPDPRALAPATPDVIARMAEALVQGDRDTISSCQAILQRLDNFLDVRDRSTDRVTGEPKARPTLIAPSIAALGAGNGRSKAQLPSTDQDDVDTDAPTDPGSSPSAAGTQAAVISMAGESMAPPPLMPQSDEDNSEPEEAPSATPAHATHALSPDDSFVPVESESPRRRVMWLFATVVVLAPIVGLLAAYQMRDASRDEIPEVAETPPPAPVAVIPVPEPVEAMAPQPAEASAAEPAIADAAPIEDPSSEAPIPTPAPATAPVEPIAASITMTPPVEPAAAPVAKPPPPAVQPTPQTAKPIPAAAKPTPPAAKSASPPPGGAAVAGAAPPKPNGTIRLDGDASQIWIEIGGAWVSPGGGVPPGTYRVRALFDGVDPVPAGSVIVKSGQETVLRCTFAGTECR